jgi:4-methyl-5(b-hydroxyethyl)-thiazole monophosphate biosynthesis
MNTLVPLANGVEEMEAVIIIDTLRRAAWNVVSVAIEGDTTVKCSRGVRLITDKLWEQIDPADFDLIVLPGGIKGTETMTAHAGLAETIRIFLTSDRIVAAICAAPLVLQAAGVLTDRSVTCHPSVTDDITITKASASNVVIDGNLITSQGPGTAMEFALTLIQHIDGEVKARQIANAMVYDY